MVWIMHTRRTAGRTSNNSGDIINDKKSTERRRTSIVHCLFITEEN